MHFRLKRLSGLLFTSACTSLGMIPSVSGQVTIAAYRMQNYDATGTTATAVWPIATGRFASGPAAGVEFRSVYVFDRSVFAGTAAQATLRIYNTTLDVYPEPWSPQPETLTLFDVSSSIGDLLDTGMNRPEIFEDLGDGVVFGNEVVSLPAANDWIEVTLNHAFLERFNAASQWVAIGAAITTLDSEGYLEALFDGGFEQTANAQLEVSIAGVGQPVPEPGTYGGAAAGFLLIVGLLRRWTRLASRRV